jgi:hypothetical protein
VETIGRGVGMYFEAQVSSTRLSGDSLGQATSTIIVRVWAACMTMEPKSCFKYYRTEMSLGQSSRGRRSSPKKSRLSTVSRIARVGLNPRLAKRTAFEAVEVRRREIQELPPGNRVAGTPCEIGRSTAARSSSSSQASAGAPLATAPYCPASPRREVSILRRLFASWCTLWHEQFFEVQTA